MGDFGEWHVGDPIGFGNDTGAPEVPYMSYGPREGEDGESNNITPEEIEERRKRIVSIYLSKEAWRLYEEGRMDEALVLINIAIENNPNNSDNHNIKGIILQRFERFNEALLCFDDALEIKADDVIKRNKAACLTRYAWQLFNNQNLRAASINIGKAEKIYSQLDDKTFSDVMWDLKAEIAIFNNDYVEALDCYKHALEVLKDDEGDLVEEYKEKRDSLLKYFEVDEIKCPRCGMKVPITDSFCIRCGAHIDIKNLG